MGLKGTTGMITIEETIEMTVTEGIMVQEDQSVISVENMDILLETVANKREEHNAIAAMKKGTSQKIALKVIEKCLWNVINVMK